MEPSNTSLQLPSLLNTYIRFLIYDAINFLHNIWPFILSWKI